MNDPYKILNIPSTASDDEVKKAYRELARKYHPDNYHDNPLADLAQEKMKEINEAYELIQKQRKSASGSYTASSGTYGYSSTSSDPTMQQVRLAINRGDLAMAERLLSAAPEHTAEWHFLMGIVASRRGWLDEARRYLETAVSMQPDNAEYRSALDAMSASGYRPAGFSTFSTCGENPCLTLCAASFCMNMCGIPCIIC